MQRRDILKVAGTAAIPKAVTTSTPTGFETTSWGRVAVSDALDDVVEAGNKEIRADGEFNLIQRSDIERLYKSYKSAAWTPATGAYRRSVLDCEEYAMAFRVYCAMQGVNGMALLHDLETEHAYVVAATTTSDGLEFVIVDPTTDELHPVDQGDLYSLGYGYRYV